jgi:hypothetical protein
MRKKKEIVELDPNRLYSLEDRTEMLRLFKTAVATQIDMDSIYHLYKKYINPKAVMYQINCKCKTSISSYYQTLLEFYSENQNKFE